MTSSAVFVKMADGSYNGFTRAEREAGANEIRKALADGRLTFASACSVCEARLGRPHQWHLEQYDDPLSAYPICGRCHYAVHIRFYRPNYWLRFLEQVPPDHWTRALSAIRDQS